jgi:hypothetical protein
MADPDERTPADRIDATCQAVRSLMLLLEAIERGELVATPLEIARLQGAVEASARSPESYREARADKRSETE